MLTTVRHGRECARGPPARICSPALTGAAHQQLLSVRHAHEPHHAAASQRVMPTTQCNATHGCRAVWRSWAALWWLTWQWPGARCGPEAEARGAGQNLGRTGPGWDGPRKMKRRTQAHRWFPGCSWDVAIATIHVPRAPVSLAPAALLLPHTVIPLGRHNAASRTTR